MGAVAAGTFVYVAVFDILFGEFASGAGGGHSHATTPSAGRGSEPALPPSPPRTRALVWWQVVSVVVGFVGMTVNTLTLDNHDHAGHEHDHEL